MPTIFDNIRVRLWEGLRKVLPGATSAAFCVGYFNLRGWAGLPDRVDAYPGTNTACCRMLIGMHRPPEELRASRERTRQP